MAPALPPDELLSVLGEALDGLLEFDDESVLGVLLMPGDVLVLGGVVVPGDSALGGVVVELGVSDELGLLDESVDCAYPMPAATAKAAVLPMMMDRKRLMNKLLS